MDTISKLEFLLNHNELERMLNIVPLPSCSETEKKRSTLPIDLSQKLSLLKRKRGTKDGHEH
jgi:hypothetical protein